MELIALKNHPVGRTILNIFSDLDNGNYALVPDNAGKTQLRKFTKSHGTDFYRYIKTVNIPFDGIRKSNLLPYCHVELNASPAGSDCQEYADALVFSV